MKNRHLFFILCTFILLSANTTAQEVNVTLKSQVIDEEGLALPFSYVKIYTEQSSVAVDSLFTDAQGKIDHILPFTYLISSLPKSFIRDNSALVKKITPNIIDRNSGRLSIEYAHPGNATLLIYDVRGVNYPNHVDLTPGLYLYQLLFDDGSSSEVEKLVLSEQLYFSVELVNSLTNTKKSQTISEDFSEVEKFYMEIIKDGYVTQRDSLLIDSAIIARDYSMEAADPPSASFSHTGQLLTGSPVVFNASNSKGVAAEELVYNWDFGDGKYGGSAQISHIYTRPGDYKVSLTVSGEYGAQNTYSETLTIIEATVAVGNTGVLNIHVSDEEGNELADARAELVEENNSTFSGTDGIATLYQLPLKKLLHVKITKEDHVTQVIEVMIPSDSVEALCLASLKKRNTSTTLYNAEFGGRLGGEDGSVVELPVLPLVDAEGKPVSGNVEVSITPIDVANETSAFPGTFYGYNEQGEEGVLLSYGVSEYHFEKDGLEIQLAEGKTAIIYIPVYTSGATIGDQIPLWSVDEESGKWIQEGIGTIVESPSSPTQLAMKAEVNHFSWYNIDNIEDPKPMEGLCWRPEHTSGQIIRRTVWCWVEGARPFERKKGLEGVYREKSLVAEQELSPPVFEVRSMLTPESNVLLMPSSSDVYMEASSVDEFGQVWRGVFLLSKDYEGDSFEIEMQLAENMDSISAEINLLYESYMDKEEVLVYSFDIPESREYTINFDTVGSEMLNGKFVLINADFSMEDVLYRHYSPIQLTAGPATVKIFGNNSTVEGGIKFGINNPDSWIEGDTVQIELDALIEDSVEIGVHKYYSVNIEEFGYYTYDIQRFGPDVINAKYKLFDDEGTRHKASVGDGARYEAFNTGKMYLGIASRNLLNTGDYSILIKKPAVETLSVNDSVRVSLNSPDFTKLFEVIPGRHMVLQSRGRVVDGSSQLVKLRQIKPDGSIMLEKEFSSDEMDFAFSLKKDTTYLFEFSSSAACEFDFITEEEAEISAAYGDVLQGTFAFEEDKHMILFSGQAGDLLYIKGTRDFGEGLFRLVRPDGKDIAERDFFYNSISEDMPDNEIVYRLEASGEYGIFVEHTAYSLFNYNLELSLLSPTVLAMDSQFPTSLLANIHTYYAFELSEEELVHLSLFSAAYTGYLNIWNEDGTKVLPERKRILYYPTSYRKAFNQLLPAGKYIIDIRSTGETNALINLFSPTMLGLDEHGEASLSGDFAAAQDLEVFAFKAGPGAGIHAQVMKPGEGTSISKASIEMYPLGNEGASLDCNDNNYINNLRDDPILNESSVKLPVEAADSLWVILVAGESDGGYDFHFHTLEASDLIQVDDDYTESPEAATSSLVAAAHAVNPGGDISIARGTYRSMLPVSIQVDDVSITGQSMDDIWIQNSYNTNAVNAFILRGNGISLSNLKISCGDQNSFAVSLQGDDGVFEHLNFTSSPGYSPAALGYALGASGDNLHINYLSSDTAIYGLQLHSDNGLVENCTLVGSQQAISLNGDHLILRNNHIRMVDNNRAITSSTGSALIENNEIRVEAATGSDYGVITVYKDGDGGTESQVKNNIIYSSSEKPVFYVQHANEQSPLTIIENNRCYLDGANGGRAIEAGTLAARGFSDVVFRNNIFEGVNSDMPVKIFGTNYFSSDHRIAIYNNNFRMHSSAATLPENDFLYLQYDNATDTVSFYFINNIVEGNGATNFVASYGNDHFYTGYNILYNFNSISQGDVQLIGHANDLSDDPKYSNNNLEVASDSPAIDQGSADPLYLYLPVLDINGVSRPQGSGVDVGAYEE